MALHRLRGPYPSGSKYISKAHFEAQGKNRGPTFGCLEPQGYTFLGLQWDVVHGRKCTVQLVLKEMFVGATLITVSSLGEYLPNTTIPEAPVT